MLTKEERDIDTLHSWVQVGGFPAQAKEEAWELESEAQCLETEGLEKMEVAVTGSEAEGFIGF